MRLLPFLNLPSPSSKVRFILKSIVLFPFSLSKKQQTILGRGGEGGKGGEGRGGRGGEGREVREGMGWD